MNDLHKVTRVSNLRRSVDLLDQNDIIASNHCVDDTLAVLHEKYGWREGRRWWIRILLYPLEQPWVKWSKDNNDEIEYKLLNNFVKVIIIKHNLGQKDFTTSQIFLLEPIHNVGESSRRYEDAVRNLETFSRVVGQNCRERMWKKHVKWSRKNVLTFISRFWAQSVFLLSSDRRTLLLRWITASIASVL